MRLADSIDDASAYVDAIVLVVLPLEEPFVTSVDPSCPVFDWIRGSAGSEHLDDVVR